ncbi:MAG: hypothetical protein QNJ38_03570 [Prochloraceae cyanobacterium]|nr:hypothetical protein [Prochloraceae cyanobacterium]
MKKFNNLASEKVSQNWDRAASIFWQEISQHQKPSKKNPSQSGSLLYRLQSIENFSSISQQDTAAFWEELAMQRT